MRIRTVGIAGALAMAATMALTSPAQASASSGSNCWGVVSSQAATTQGGLGSHASSFDEPRLGIGNVAKLFGLSGPGELGQVLASLDDNPATSC